jgi:SAM-dependent methyltransferase
MSSLFDQTETSFDNVDRATQAGSFPTYLTRMAADLAGVKRELHDLLAPRPGEAVLDVGCGNGADIGALARRVGPDGWVVGVDNSQLLIEEAQSRPRVDGPPVLFRVADAHDLPYPDATFDATRAERVMMHLAHPDRALAELVRVTKPGGRVLVADPDHGMWALDSPDLPVTRSLLAWWFDFIANPWIARRTPAMFGAAGMGDVAIAVKPVVLPSLESADAMTGLRRAAALATANGVITDAQAADFDAHLAAADQQGRFFMCGAVIATVGHTPTRG